MEDDPQYLLLLDRLGKVIHQLHTLGELAEQRAKTPDEEHEDPVFNEGEAHGFKTAALIVLRAIAPYASPFVTGDDLTASQAPGVPQQPLSIDSDPHYRRYDPDDPDEGPPY
jgi:hypothetical protein